MHYRLPLILSIQAAQALRVPGPPGVCSGVQCASGAGALGTLAVRHGGSDVRVEPSNVFRDEPPAFARYVGPPWLLVWRRDRAGWFSSVSTTKRLFF